MIHVVSAPVTDWKSMVRMFMILVVMLTVAAASAKVLSERKML